MGSKTEEPIEQLRLVELQELHRTAITRAPPLSVRDDSTYDKVRVSEYA
jgi:hypothetical protein